MTTTTINNNAKFMQIAGEMYKLFDAKLTRRLQGLYSNSELFDAIPPQFEHVSIPVHGRAARAVTLFKFADVNLETESSRNWFVKLLRLASPAPNSRTG